MSKIILQTQNYSIQIPLQYIYIYIYIYIIYTIAMRDLHRASYSLKVCRVGKAQDLRGPLSFKNRGLKRYM